MNAEVDANGMSRRGLVMNVFGEYVDPADLPPAPPECRTIVITDEICAADAAKLAKREEDAVSVWPIKAELNAENLRTRKPLPTPGRVAAKPKRAAVLRISKAVADVIGRVPLRLPVAVPVLEMSVEVQEETEIEMKTNTTLDRRECAVANCEKDVTAKNKSGRCSAHWYLAKGTKMRDGSIWAGSMPAKSAKPAKVVKAAPVAAPRAHAVWENIAAGVVMLPVTESALDAFWGRLVVADKIRIVSAELAR